jgi:D-alanyl-D-alanine carboxypeptidase
MENITIDRKGNILTITVDLSKTGTPSASGKTMVIASTKGNHKIEGDIFVGVNVYKPR